MKKLIVAVIFFSLLGCAEREEYKQVIKAQMMKDKDVQDYKIDPEVMASCIVDVTSKKMPGFLPIDPERRLAYINYVKMIQLNKAENPKQLLDDLRNAFGSPKGLADAHSNYAGGVVECMSGLVTNNEKPN